MTLKQVNANVLCMEMQTLCRESPASKVAAIVQGHSLSKILQILLHIKLQLQHNQSQTLGATKDLDMPNYKILTSNIE